MFLLFAHNLFFLNVLFSALCTSSFIQLKGHHLQFWPQQAHYWVTQPRRLQFLCGISIMLHHPGQIIWQGKRIQCCFGLNRVHVNESIDRADKSERAHLDWWWQLKRFGGVILDRTCETGGITLGQQTGLPCLHCHKNMATTVTIPFVQPTQRGKVDSWPAHNPASICKWIRRTEIECWKQQT